MAKDKNGKDLPKGIRLRADGRYEGRFRYASKDYSVIEKTVKDCEKRFNDLRYEVQHGTYIKEENITVADWFKIWNEEYKEPSVKKGTVHTYQTTYDNYIKSVMGKQRLKDIRPEHIQKLYNDLYRKEFSRNTLELVSVVLSGMFKQAVKNKIIHENPVLFATLPKIYQESERRVMSTEEQQLFMKYAKESKLSDLLELALSTGMRSGELRALEWSDVDFKTKIIHVIGTLNCYDGKWVKDTPKTPTSKRDIPMLDNVYNILKTRRTKQMEWRMLIGQEWEPLERLDNLIFTNDAGKPLNRDRFKKELDKVVNDIQSDGYNFENIHPHTFRHPYVKPATKKFISFCPEPDKN